MNALGCCIELDRRIALRGARETLEIPEGWVVRHPELASVYSLNGVFLRSPLSAGMGAVDLSALAERWLGDLDHRLIRVEDGTAGERLAPELVSAGWERQRTVLMVLRGAPDDLSQDPRARQIGESELDQVMLADFEQTPFVLDGLPGLAQMLVAAQAELRAGTPALAFGAGEGGALQSMCTLFLDDDVAGRRMAMVEQVATLASHRERGLAKATVSAAVAAAGRWGADLIAVPADADDWPQLLYAGLGFEPVGRHVTFMRRP